MAAQRSLWSALLLVCLAGASAQQLYQRPANFSGDCLPDTVRAATFSAVFPSDFFVTGGTVSSQDKSTTITFAKNFEVAYFPTYKVVTNTYTNQSYVLYQCGGTRPSANAVPGAKLFEIPLTSVSVPDTVPYAFLDILNVTDRVQSVSSFAVSPCAQQLLACNKTAVSDTDLNNATVLDAQVLPYVDGITATTALDPPAPADAPIFTFSASQDPGESTLNRAEWVKFLGLFFNMDKEASEYFDSIEKQYNSIKATAANATNKPTVAWITHYVYAPDEYYQISFAAYKVQYTQDAGGMIMSEAAVKNISGVTVDAFDVTNSTYDFAWNGTQKGFESQAQARLAFLTALQNVDVVIDETYAVSPTNYTYDQFLMEYNITSDDAQGLAFLNGTGASAVLREDGLISPSGGLDWFEGAIAHPEGVLEDLNTALKAPTSTARNFTWFRNVQQMPKTVGPSDCAIKDACDVKPTPICPLISECPDGTIVDLVNAATCAYATCDSSNSTASAASAPGSGSGSSAAAPAPQAAATAAALTPLALAAAGAALLLAL